MLTTPHPSTKLSDSNELKVIQTLVSNVMYLLQLEGQPKVLRMVGTP